MTALTSEGDVGKVSKMCYYILSYHLIASDTIYDDLFEESEKIQYTIQETKVVNHLVRTTILLKANSPLGIEISWTNLFLPMKD